MTRLTEEMVALRTKISNMNHVKKLNCWGTGITDISVVKHMKNLEVLALSVNSISSLEPVRDLPLLQTLYLRRNQIKDLIEVLHLKTLPALKFVWLDENPFCEKLGSKYRGTILRMLPNIERLDDKEVTDAERHEALKSSSNTASPRAASALEEESSFDSTYEGESPQPPNAQQNSQNYYQVPTQQQQYDRNSPTQQHQSPPSPQHSPPYKQNSPPLQSQQPQHHSGQTQQYQRHAPYGPPDSSYSPQQHSHQHQRNSPHESTHPPSPKYDSTPQQNRLSYQQPNDRSPEHDSPQIGYQSCYRESGPIPPSISTQSMKEYYQSDRPAYPLHYARSQTDLSEWTENQIPPRRSAGTEREILERHGFRTNGSALRENGLYDNTPRSHCAYHRRILNRNSNLLSATLCLIKEMDINSLEVVEHAVRSRINEYSID